MRTIRVVPAAAHLDRDPGRNGLRNLRGLCQPSHILQRAWKSAERDAEPQALQHVPVVRDPPCYPAQRWITYRRRYVLGDLFLRSRHRQTAYPDTDAERHAGEPALVPAEN